ncbi:triacylglycerol lipase [Ruminococcus sp. YRD2003]|nr:triacylglycerol lipase [Ruminococcus flavefaciens]
MQQSFLFIIMRFLDLFLLLVFYNLVPLWTTFTGVPVAARVVFTVVISIVYLVILLRGEKTPLKSFRMRSLRRGLSLTWLTGASILCEWLIIAVYIILTPCGAVAKAFSVVMPVLAVLLTFIVAVVRTAIGSKQMKLLDYLLLFIFWWLFPLNLVLLAHFFRKARREYWFEADKAELDISRAENEICRTKYPIVMVHGIFFRDWQFFNYWGRVPAELKRNGALVYYGNQQSARSVHDSAVELKAAIMQVIEETGAEKVNIIAHSKGGLDSRYAISCLGMDKYVATLTTVNTPHNGCDMVDFLLGKVPGKIADGIARKYDRIFGRLGDSRPDFMAGVRDLSAVRMQSLNKEMPDSPAVSYRSCMSVMKCFLSAGFPLCISYLIIKKLNGRNDGLVWEESAKHGRFRLVDTKHIRGISHGDVIDLMRENIEDYDVREFYTGLVAELKREGY